MIGKTGYTVVLFACLLLAVSGCTAMMDEQAKIEPLEPSAFFPNGQSARPILDNTVPRTDVPGVPDASERFLTGVADGEAAAGIPVEVSAEFLERGRERYNIFCSPCHGYVGDGSGMIVQRGFPAPPSFHDERLRNAPAGHYFDVITNGFGVMYPYGSRVPPADRWAIIAYIRALQLSQNAPVELLPPEDTEQLPAGESGE